MIVLLVKCCKRPFIPPLIENGRHTVNEFFSKIQEKGFSFLILQLLIWTENKTTHYQLLTFYPNACHPHSPIYGPVLDKLKLYHVDKKKPK